MFTLAVVWTIFVAGLLIWRIAQVKQNTLESARIQARVAEEKDIIYQNWTIEQGGVYLEVTDSLQPDPYLSVPERDIITPSGRLLTLVHPVTMTRLVNKFARERFGVLGKITSLEPVRPENKPDTWEREALQAFEQRKSEVSSVQDIGGHAYMHLMRPLLIEKACLQCHTGKEGDVRGGISVSIPMQPLWAIERTMLLQLSLSYSAIWLMGLWGVIWVGRWLRRSQEELLHSKRFTENIVATVPSGLVVISKESEVLSVNRSFCELFKLKRQEVVGQSVDAVLQTIGLSEECRTAIAARRPFRNLECTCSIPRKHSGELTLNLTLSGIRLAEEEEEEGLLVMDDITERKRVEQEERSLEEQFHQVQKLESVGTLATGIAHDFNNILCIIIGHASLLEGLPANPDTIKKHTEAITKASIRGADLVKQLLTIARKSDVVFKSVILNDIVTEVARLLGETFPKTIAVSFHLEKDLPLIEADATQLNQVLLNLCVNARDAMPNGGTLTITLHREPGEMIRTRLPKATAHEYIVLSVADTGIGMDEATRLRIFEPFFTTKERGKGTGLGLSLVFSIMESHSGFIDVQSAPGKGTTVLCYFPVSQKPIGLEQVKDQSAEGVPGGSETVLLVEDEEMLRELAKAMLEAKGYTVLTACDGEEGVEVYQRHQTEIQLVISDLGLPKFGGDKLYRKLKMLNPRVHMILASGYIEPGMKAQILGEGVKAFIQKPYNLNEVLQAMRSVLDKA